MFYIVRNQKSNLEIGIHVKERPKIPAPEFRYEEIEIPGRSGILIQESGLVDDLKIEVVFNFAAKPDLWMEQFREAKKWLLAREDDQLILSDDLEMFYKVKHTSVDTAERYVKTLGEFSATFLCEGFQYRRDGQHEHTIEEVKYNPYYLSQPVYKIRGNGTCELKVNGKSMITEVQGNLTIDTERMLAYNESGVLKNTMVTGNYEDFLLMEMENTISCSMGFDLSIIPNWRCL